MAIEAVIHCDANLTSDCYCLASDIVAAASIRAVQAAARQDGWRVRGRKAICPDCLDRGATLNHPRPNEV